MVITKEMMDCNHPSDQWTSTDLGNHKFKVKCKLCNLEFEYNQKKDIKTLYENPQDFGLKFKGFAKEF